jgi:Family of unknown function (DUF5985)
MRAIQSAVYLLCFLTSASAMLLLLRGYGRTGTRILLLSAVGFVLFALNNLLLFVDIVLLPDTDLLPYRQLTGLIGVAILLLGFIWEID